MTDPLPRARSTHDQSSPKLTDSNAGRDARAASRRAGSTRTPQPINPMPNGLSTSERYASSRCSSAVDPALPIPIMPKPPERVTAAASAPPATPPIGALRIGADRPIAAAHGVESLFISLTSVAQAHSAYLQDADVDAGAAKVVENAVAQGPFRGGHPRQAPSIATCTASSVSDTMRRPPPWDSATSPVLVGDDVGARPGRRRRRFPRGSPCGRPARAWPADPRAGEVGLFTTDLDAGEPALFEQLPNLPGSRPALRASTGRPGTIPVPRSRIGWCRDPRFVRNAAAAVFGVGVGPDRSGTWCYPAIMVKTRLPMNAAV